MTLALALPRSGQGQGHDYEQFLKLAVGLPFMFRFFVRMFRFSILCVFFCFVLDCFVLVLLARFQT